MSYLWRDSLEKSKRPGFYFPKEELKKTRFRESLVMSPSIKQICSEGELKGAILNTAFVSRQPLTNLLSYSQSLEHSATHWNTLHDATQNHTTAHFDTLQQQSKVHWYSVDAILAALHGGMSHIWMSHVTHMNQSCRTHEWVISRTWRSRITRIN